MPNYDYHCKACNHTLEAFQKITDAPLKSCPQCGKDQLHRGPGGGLGFSLQGSGWYKTGYAEEKPAPDAPAGGCCPCGKTTGSCQ